MGIIFIVIGVVLLWDAKFWKHSFKEEVMAGVKLEGFIGGIGLIIIGILIMLRNNNLM